MQPGPLHNEKELLNSIADGDEKAFTAVVDHYSLWIYTVALTFIKSVQEAEDIVQEVFLKIWYKRNSLATVEKFDSYLFITARNIIISIMRKKKPVVPSYLWLSEKSRQESLEELPEEKLKLKQLAEIINRGVEQLPPQQQLIFKMSREQGLSHNEICKKLNLAKSTVKNSLVKALNFLRNYTHTQSGELILLACSFIFS